MSEEEFEAENERIGWKRYLLQLVLHLTAVISGVSVLTHISVQDMVPGLSAVHYLVPLPLATSLLLALGFYWGIRKRKRRAFTATVFWISAAVLLGARWHHSAPVFPSEGPRVEMLAWNISEGRLGPQRVAAALSESTADVIVIWQAGDLVQQSDYWGRCLPNHTFIPFGEEGSIVLLVRGSVSSPRLERVHESALLATCEVETQGLDFELAIVGTTGFPLREPPQWLVELEDKISTEAPLVLVGDFGVSRFSQHCHEIRATYQSCFEEAGSGYGADWPAFAPLWDTSHAWVSRDWKVLEWQSDWTSRSTYLPFRFVLTPDE